MKRITLLYALAATLMAVSYTHLPNNAILGSNSLRFPIPFGLWIYNDFVKYQDKKLSLIHI